MLESEIRMVLVFDKNSSTRLVRVPHTIIGGQFKVLIYSEPIGTVKTHLVFSESSTILCMVAENKTSA